jgi:hypothetical protein
LTSPLKMFLKGSFLIKRRQPLTNGKLHPRICGIALDAMALDRDGSSRDAFVDRLLALEEAGDICFLEPGTVYQQTQHPKTPADVQEVMRTQIFTLPTGLTPAEQDRRRRVLAVMRGNSLTDQHDADAAILFEAGKYGCGYLITEDKQILRNQMTLEEILGPPLCIVTLTEFMAIYDKFVEEERERDKLLGRFGNG